MSRMVLTRIGMALISLLAVSAIIFWCVELLPGDAAERILGRNATPESLALLREKLHLNLSAGERYLRWLSALLSGDLGTSIVADRPVLDYISSRIANTALLSGFALLLYIPVSIALGVITAIYRG